MTKSPTKPKSQRGGSRPGAGRHSVYGVNMDRFMIRIPPQHTKLLKEVSPNISQAVRTLLDDPEILARIESIVTFKKVVDLIDDKVKRNRADATYPILKRPRTKNPAG